MPSSDPRAFLPMSCFWWYCGVTLLALAGTVWAGLQVHGTWQSMGAFVLNLAALIFALRSTWCFSDMLRQER